MAAVWKAASRNEPSPERRALAWGCLGALTVLGVGGLLDTSLYAPTLMLPGALPSALLVFSLTVAAFGGLGLIVASLTIAFKRSEPVASFISISSLLLGGVYFPVEALPGWLHRFAALTPLTPALDGLRLCLLADAPLSELRPALVALSIFVVVLIPAGALLFRWALRRAMRDGTLTQY